MASYYESETRLVETNLFFQLLNLKHQSKFSGYNPDRFTGDLEAKESTFTKIKGTYWKTKQILCDKLGLPSDDGGGQNATEDDHEFDKLLTNFRAIEGSTKQLEDNFRKHHKNIGGLF